MSEKCTDILRCDPQDLRQAMSIHTRKITDSCRDKDCIEDLRVYLTRGSQSLLDTCAGAKVRCAELLYTYIDVEPVAFDRNHYCIDVTFYYRVLADATIGTGRPAALYGLAVFTKRAVLCGEDSRAHIYRSDTRLCEADGMPRRYANRPTAVVEVLDPMVLSSRVREVCEDACREECALQIPSVIRDMFDAHDIMKTGLIGWRYGCNSFMYQADHLGMPGYGAVTAEKYPSGSEFSRFRYVVYSARHVGSVTAPVTGRP